MHDLRRPHDLAAEDLADALVAEAHPEHRAPAGERADHLVGQSRIIRGAGAGGDQDGVGVEGEDLIK